MEQVYLGLFCSIILTVTSQDTCPKWTFSSGQNLVDEWGAIYLPPIQKRMNAILKPIQLTTGDVCCLARLFPLIITDSLDFPV